MANAGRVVHHLLHRLGDARNAVATICAIYEAAKTGRTVQVK